MSSAGLASHPTIELWDDQEKRRTPQQALDLTKRWENTKDRPGDGPKPSPKALDFCDADSGNVLTEAFSGFRFEWPKLEAAAPQPPQERPLDDLRLQMQAAKLAFIVSKRRGELERLGVTLRVEAGRPPLHDLLHRTFFDRLCSGDGSGCSCDLVNVSGGSFGMGYGSGGEERGGGGASSVQECCKMMFVYNKEMGWVFLHQVTGEVVEAVKGFVRDIECQELGLTVPGNEGNSSSSSTLLDMVSLFNQTPDVSVKVDGGIVTIAGTKDAVAIVSRSVETAARKPAGEDSTAHWYCKGDPLDEGICPLFQMPAEVSATLEKSLVEYLGGVGSPLVRYAVAGNIFEANFLQMLQKNCRTGTLHALERMAKQQQPRAWMPRCPESHITLSVFEEANKYSLVQVSNEEANSVKIAVWHTYGCPIARVEHIWNPFQWGHYAQNAKVIGNECLLFHGSSPKTIDIICKSGFDRSFAGSKNGSAYGLGCYFARDAYRAAHYMGPSKGQMRQMIMAKVLVGQFTVGKSSMKRPPTISSFSEYRTYDSTSDHPQSPTIIVTYTDWQAYPMYLITFEA